MCSVLEPFIAASPVSLAASVGIAHLLGHSPEMSLSYAGMMAASTFAGNIVCLWLLIAGITIISAVAESDGYRNFASRFRKDVANV